MEFIDEQLKKIENEISFTATQDDLFEKLRHIGLGDFGTFLLSLPDPAYPKISAILPRMASQEIQQNWTGNSGIDLLKQSMNFVRSIAYNFCKYTGEPLENKAILDFGCGYGRIARLMYYFTNPGNFFGVDPWDKSIEICNNDGLKKNFFVSDYIPFELPTGKKKFSLIYAFSVFTHLSKKTTIVSLETLLAHLEPNGILVITIRPVEFWHLNQEANTLGLVEKQIATHKTEGFSFLPHNRPPVNGEITYGDTSMSLQWLKNSIVGIQILGIDRSIDDPYQIYVFLRRR